MFFVCVCVCVLTYPYVYNTLVFNQLKLLHPAVNKEYFCSYYANTVAM